MFRSKLLNLMAYFQAMVLACLLTIAAAAQQADPSEPDDETPETATADDANPEETSPAEATDDADVTADEAEDIENADLDEQTYEQDDDDFVPTEEIPADEPIPFPSNI